MTLHSTLSLLALSANHIIGNLHPKSLWPWKGEPMDEGKDRSWDADRQQRSCWNVEGSWLLDHEPDSNSATLEAGPLLESFTTCSVFMVEAWTTQFSEAVLFTLLDNDGITWAKINMYATPSHTWYLSRAPREYPCKFFLAGVNFYRFNAKNWQFTV